MKKMASGVTGDRQKKLGPAPIASFEDLSEDVDNGEQQQQQVQRMPGIIEAMTPVTPSNSLKTPSTPRIDISRASSSSQHDDSNNNSEESSPERELLAGGELAAGCQLTLGYKEDVQDLRSSTEELDLQDPIHEQDLNREIKRARKRKEDGTQSECGTSGKQLQEKERNNSVCSEIILLNISGRTSRLSSVGSQGSGISGKLSVVSNTSSRSPSPHKCMLETSFCGSKRTLTENLIEPTKPETEDLEKMLLRREADTTKALIPENIRIPIVDGNLKPDPLDKPRLRGREERKEIFKREVEITKKVLEKVNIQVPIIKKVQQSDQSKNSSSSAEIQKPVTLDLNDKRRKAQDVKDIVVLQSSPTVSGSPKSQRHQKFKDKDFELSRTPSPSSTSRKSSFASLFKARTDGNVISPESPSSHFKPRRSLTSKLKETASETLKNVAKSRERASIDKGTTLKRDSKNKGVFSSTLSLFRKRERKKSEADEATDYGVASMESLPPSDPSPSHFESQAIISSTFESIGNVEFVFNSTKHVTEEVALPSESVSIPLETPTKLLDEYEIASSGSKIQTEAKIEVPPQTSWPRTSVRQEKVQHEVVKNGSIRHEPSRVLSQSSSRESIMSSSSTKKPSVEVTKPKRKSREKQLSKQSDSSFEETTTRAPISKANELSEQQALTNVSNMTSDVDHNNSSESERDSEIDFVKNHKIDGKNEAARSDDLQDERKRLFYEESFEEDLLPYVPTTLPLEKSIAVPILPVKERLQEVKTIPIERPRSTTPINPTLLDEFVQHTTQDGRRTDKMKISLPRDDSLKAKSPRRTGVANTFTAFAGRVTADATASHSGSKGVAVPSSFGNAVSPSFPPLPPRGQQPPPPRKQPPNWINFEDIPERRKTPKRIQTIPRQEEEPKGGTYSFVQPEECRCECHEESRKASLRESSSCSRSSSSSSGDNASNSCNGGENCTAASSTGERGGSVVSDSSLDYSLNNEEQSLQALLGPTKPFGMDLDVHSTQSSVLSQEEIEDADL